MVATLRLHCVIACRVGPASCFIIPRDIFWFVHHRAKAPPWQGTGQVGVGHALSGRLSAVYVLARGHGDPAACYQKHQASGLSEYAPGIWTQRIRTQKQLMHVLVKRPAGRALDQANVYPESNGKHNAPCNAMALTREWRPASEPRECSGMTQITPTSNKDAFWSVLRINV